jgi:hypothetical protein
MVWNMGAHGGKPFHGVENLLGAAVFGRVDDGSLIGKVLHPLLGEGSPDDVSGQVFHGCVILGRDAFPAKRKPECRHPASIATISRVIFPLVISMRKTLCRKRASSFFISRGGAMRNMPLP